MFFAILFSLIVGAVAGYLFKPQIDKGLKKIVDKSSEQDKF